MVLNYEKCHFMVESSIVLGHVISGKGIEVDSAKIEIISTLPYLATMRKVHSFLRHIGFYRRFIQNFNHIAQPLTNLVQHNTKFIFNDNCKTPFDHLKKCLTTILIIQPPDWTLPFKLMCDASNYAVGAQSFSCNIICIKDPGFSSG